MNQQQPPPIVIDPQITLMGEIYPPAPFEHFVLAHIRNDVDSKQYDVLFPSDETAPPITQQTDEVRQLAAHYNMTFVDAICDEVPCLVNVITLTATWKEKVVTEPAAPSYSMEQLQAMAMLHFSRTMIKDKAAAKSNYFTAWATDMAAFIKAAGGAQKDFLNKICSYYDSTTK